MPLQLITRYSCQVPRRYLLRKMRSKTGWR